MTNSISPFWRYYYDLKPGKKMVVFRQATEITLGPHNVVLVPANCLFHTIGPQKPIPHFWLHFSFARQPSPHQSIPITLAPSVAERALLKELLKLLDGWPHYHKENCFQILHCSLALLNRTLCRPEVSWLPMGPEGFTRVIRHIEENFGSPLYTDDLARLCGLGRTAFNRMFRKHQGMSPAQFITKVRLREVSNMLLHTTLSLGEIAERSGFESHFYLSRIFKKLTGHSPARYRKQHEVTARALEGG